MKKSMIFVGILAIAYANAQEGSIGINTNNPKATLEVNVANINSSNDSNQGIIAPRLTKNRIAQIAQTNLVEGTLVYATDTTYTGANTTVSKITEKGYYYYNGTEWVKVQYKDSDVDTSLYSNDGTLSNNRTVNTNGKNLLFTGTGKIGIGTDNPTQKLEVIGNGKYSNAEGSARIEVSAAQMSYPYIRFSKGDVARWDMGTRNTEETGNDVGSEFYISPKGDDGSNRSNALTIQRNTYNVGIGTNNPEERLDIGNYSGRIAGRIFYRTTTQNSLSPSTKEIISVKEGGQNPKELETWKTYEIVLNAASEVNHLGAKYIVYHDSIEKKWKSKFVSGSNRSAKLEIADSGKEIQVWHEVPNVTYHIRANIMSLNNYSIAGTSQYNFGLDGAMANLNGNVGVGTETPTQKLEVNGKIKASNVIFTGIPTYADDTSASAGGLVAGEMYKTSTGELRIKL